MSSKELAIELSTISLHTSQVQETGNPVDIMHYHFSWDGFFEGSWRQAKNAYLKIMRDPSNMKLVTVLREPVSHYLSYYYYFLQPETRVRSPMLERIGERIVIENRWLEYLLYFTYYLSGNAFLGVPQNVFVVLIYNKHS